MRKLIAGMQTSVDGKIEGPEGYADWVESWADNYDLIPHIDACVLGGGMYPGHEQYWTAILENEPGQVLPITGTVPTPAEVDWARFASTIPHYVLSNTLTTASWPNTRFIHGPDDVADLKELPGKDIYLIGGARTVASLIDAGLVDELRLHVHPLIAGEGTTLFGTTTQRRELELRDVRQLHGGRVGLVYGFR